MEKIPFKITAEKQGGKALIRITGEIGWDVDADSFRREVDMLVRAGVTDAHLYLNGPGGSCFDANEIVNILSAFTGEVTGEGGALVASAYTYIAMHCKSFVMPANGQFMIHKPSGCVSGTAGQILAYHKLLSNMESTYLAKYKEHASNVAELESRWEAGDWWMTAQEALDAGFITGIKEQAKIDRATALMIAACGYPDDTALLINTKTDNNMDLKTLAVSLGMPEDATEDQIRARVAENRRNAERLADVERQARERERKELDAKIKAVLDKAVTEKRIKADMRDKWKEKLEDDFEGVSAMLESITPVTSLSGQIKTDTEGGRINYKGKNFEQLQEEDPDALAELQDRDPEAFERLFADWKKRNKMK